jgi:hypothetical protein
MRNLTVVVAVAAVLALTGMPGTANADKSSSKSRVEGTYVRSGTNLCHYSAAPFCDPDVSSNCASEVTTANNTQPAGAFGTYYFDGRGGVTVDFLVNNFNVPAGTRSTAEGTCTGTYHVEADRSVTSEVTCTSTTTDGFGYERYTVVSPLKSRYVKAGADLSQMPAGPPSQETVQTWFPGEDRNLPSQHLSYRKCSRSGFLHKIDDED